MSIPLHYTPTCEAIESKINKRCRCPHTRPGEPMFGWFKSRQAPPPRSDEAKADTVLKRLSAAIAEVHPDRFCDPLDAALVTQPYLASVKLFLGKDSLPERFNAVRFNDLVERTAELEGTGLLTNLITIIGNDTVMMPIYLAALHELHGVAKKDEVRRQAELLLTYLAAGTRLSVEE
jgi:hypothetical protein